MNWNNALNVSNLKFKSYASKSKLAHKSISWSCRRSKIYLVSRIYFELSGISVANYRSWKNFSRDISYFFILVSGQFLNCEGSGLYKVQSRCKDALLRDFRWIHLLIPYYYILQIDFEYEKLLGPWTRGRSWVKKKTIKWKKIVW